MASIFTKDDKFVDKPNRNTFDLSFQNNLSLKFGKLIPCFCQEVLPGDSFKITPTFGLRFLPQVFPVQTRMKAHLHFFYCRNRTVWNDWTDFIGKTKTGLTVPYLQTPTVSNELFDNEPSYFESSIYDYMGLPCTLDSDLGNESAIYLLYSSRGQKQNVILPQDLETNSGAHAGSYSVIGLPNNLVGDGNNYLLTTDGKSIGSYRAFVKPISFGSDGTLSNADTFTVKYDNQSNISGTAVYLLCKVYSTDLNFDGKLAVVHLEHFSGNGNQPRTFNVPNFVPVKDGESTASCGISEILGYVTLKINGGVADYEVSDDSLSVQIIPKYNRGYPFSGFSLQTLPYGNGDWQFRVNALPFRHYQAIYNSFYRNAENNPFKINGVVEYNKYVNNMDGGPQNPKDFFLYNRNWEDDAFTTAVPTPQQGDAPRVGLTGDPTGIVTVQVYNEDGSLSNVGLMHDSQGRVILAGSEQSTSDSSFANAVNDAVNFGITINDFRNTNALQLWLEKNVRRGYKYPDQMMSHYGVRPAYDDLLMPEFIGGVSRDVTVNQISQTVENSEGNLGDIAGQSYVVGEGHSVQRYCDEHGYIIGILSVVPTPNYSQFVPKHFFKHDTFDYFFPEFGKIGMQPITNKEIALTASWLEHKGDDTFGYQRAWYDYLANVDQVHGKFNSDFYDFLIQRKFGSVPELGESFTTVQNEQLNNIFYVDDNEDKILGQIYFDVKAIRPLPLFGIPSLE